MNCKKSKKLKNKYVTVEDMNELLDLVSLINYKLDITTAHTKALDPMYTKEIELQTGVYSAIQALKNKLKNT